MENKVALTIDHPQMPVSSVAPALTDEKLARYTEIASELVGEMRYEYDRLLACVKAWWELPESNGEVTKFRTSAGDVLHVKEMEPEYVAALDGVTPYLRETRTLHKEDGSGLFDSLTGEIKDAAFMLIWYATEIALDREPTKSQHRLASYSHY